MTEWWEDSLTSFCAEKKERKNKDSIKLTYFMLTISCLSCQLCSSSPLLVFLFSFVSKATLAVGSFWLLSLLGAWHFQCLNLFMFWWHSKYSKPASFSLTLFTKFYTKKKIWCISQIYSLSRVCISRLYFCLLQKLRCAWEVMAQLLFIFLLLQKPWTRIKPLQNLSITFILEKDSLATR